MSPKVQFHNHPCEPVVEFDSFIKFGSFEKEPKSVAGPVEISVIEEAKTMSVRTLRNLFLQKTLEEEELVGTAPALQATERDVVLDCGKTKDHYEWSECRSETASSDTEGGKSVMQLKQLYEAKLSALSSSGGQGGTADHPFECACSRPPTAKTDDRQNTAANEKPHPDGQCVFFAEPVEGKPKASWYVASNTIKEIPNGLHLSIVLKCDD